MHNILVTGASGFIGSYLLKYFSDEGANIFAHSRRDLSNKDTDRIKWISNFDDISNIDIHLVINLAGENIRSKRWSTRRKIELIDSRVFNTRDLYEWLDKNNKKPHMIINASSLAYYGIDVEKKWLNSYTEMSPPQPFFSSQIFQELEHEINFFEQNSKILRLGNVFAKDGGVFNDLLDPIKKGKYGQIDDGWHPINWVHIEDVFKTIKFLYALNPAQKVFNVVAPERLSQKQFAYHCGKHFNKSGKFNNLPYLVFETLHGEKSDILINGQYCKPQNLLNLGYRFEYHYFQHALHDLAPINTKSTKRNASLFSGIRVLKYFS